MGTQHTPFEQLTITNKFMFAMVFSHKEIPKRARFYQAMRDCEALSRGEKYRDLKELYIIFLCPNDIFGKNRAVYRFKNLETDDPKIEMGDLSFKNFYIFSKYREIAEKAIREYMEYFATNKAHSPETEDIDRLVKWYQTDSNTRIRYMTWQEEIDDMKAIAEEERARADKEKARADEIQKLADEEKARADKYEKILRELGKL